MSYYDEQMRKVLNQRAGDWLIARHWPRTTAIIGVVVVLLTVYICSTGLMWAGLQNMAGRLALSVISGYLVLLLYLGLWLLLVPLAPVKSLLIHSDHPNRTEVPGETEFDKKLNDSFDHAIRESTRNDDTLGRLVTVALLGGLFVGFHFVFHAPWYLGGLMVDVGKIQHRSIPSGQNSVFVALLRRSWPLAVLLVVHYAMIGATIQLLMRVG